MRKDIDISFKKHPLTGDIVIKSESSAVRQSVKNLIMTNFYERGFNINPATDLNASLFSSMSDLDKATIKNKIEEVLRIYEPDIEVSQVILRTEREYLYLDLYYVYVNNEEEQLTIELI
jgi:phage baseplate assembly protein W